MARSFLAMVAAAAALSLVPLLTTNRALLNWMFLMLLYAAIAQSWNLIGGFAGQVNLGHAAFFGLGALTTRILWLRGVPVPLALVGGAAAATLAGVILGVPSLRLRGPYFAIATLAGAEILRITTGNVLAEVSSLPARFLATYSLAPRVLLAILLTAAVTAAALWLSRSRFGYGVVSVREDEEVAEALGVDTFRHKLAAFVLSAAFAGTAGGLFAYYHLSFYPQFAFSPLWTFDALLITFLGGVGTVWGPLLGAAFFLVLRETLALRLPELHLLIFGLVFIVVVVALPGGFMEGLHALWARRLTGRPPALDRRGAAARGVEKAPRSPGGS